MKQKMKTSTFKAEASLDSSSPPRCLIGSICKTIRKKEEPCGGPSRMFFGASWRNIAFWDRPLSWRTCAALPVTWRSPWQLLCRTF